MKGIIFVCQGDLCINQNIIRAIIERIDNNLDIIMEDDSGIEEQVMRIIKNFGL